MRYLILTTLISVVGLGWSVKSCQNLKKEKERLGENQSTLLEEIHYYKTRESLSVASVQRLSLTKKELERHKGELLEQVKGLGLKVKRLQHLSVASVQGVVRVKTPVLQEVIIEQVKGVALSIPIQKFAWSDPWLSISGLVKAGQLEATIQSKDTLIQVVHRVPRRFWFIKWGTKAIRQEILSKNPHTTIVFTEYIELKR